MSPAAALLEEALKLAPSERGQIIHALLASLEPEGDEPAAAVEAAWAEEIARRVAASDDEPGVDVDTLSAEWERKRQGTPR